MKRLAILTVFGLLALCAGCIPLQTVSLEPTPIPTLIPATLPLEVMAFSSPAPAPTAAKATEPTTPPASFAGLPLSAARNELFAASGVCAACHTRLTDASGADVSHDSLWRSTLLANAARDPYWQASVTATRSRTSAPHAIRRWHAPPSQRREPKGTCWMMASSTHKTTGTTWRWTAFRAPYATRSKRRNWANPTHSAAATSLPTKPPPVSGQHTGLSSPNLLRRP